MSTNRRCSMLAIAAANSGGGDVEIQPIIDINKYLTIVSLEDELTVMFSPHVSSTQTSLEYCVDGDGNWKKLTSNTVSESINKGHMLSFKGNLGILQYEGVGTFIISKFCNLIGNCTSILNNHISSYAFVKLFKDCTTIQKVSSNFLPTTKLENHCYQYMFSGCTSLTTAPELPATTLASNCYQYMFSGCSSLTTAPELPATTLASYCYYQMFYECTSLITAPALPATTLANYCYNLMFYGTNVLPDCSNIDFSSSTVVASGGLIGLFAGTKVTDSDLRSILPINSNGKYYLPVITLTTNCYQKMFSGCTSLTTAPELPATTLASYCYQYMFSGCTSLTTAPELPATTLASNCYYRMFYGCSKLNYIKAMFTTTPSSSYTNNWVYGVASSGTFVKNIDATWDVTGTSGIPSGWTVSYAWTPQTCINLSILADNVSKGNQSTTTIHYTALCEGVDENGIVSQKTLTGDAEVEIGQNKTTSTVQKTVSFTYLNKTATTTITQGPWVNVSYTVNLNNQWQLSSTVSNPNSSLYEGVYQSYANKGVNSSGDSMYIDINGYTNFKLYIRSYAESSYDYVMVSQLDKTLTYSSSYSDTTLVKAHTRGKQQSGTALSNYTLVEFTNIPSGSHRIQIIYRKDSSSHSGDDRGYVLIPRNQ